MRGDNIPPRSEKGPGRGQAARGVELRRKVMDLRVAGVTFETIGRQLGISRQVAHRHYQRAFAEETAKTGDLIGEERDLVRRRLDALVSAHWMKKGEPRHGVVIIRAERERIRLLGLAAPTQLEVAGKNGQPIEVTHPAMPLELLTDEELEILKEISLKVTARAAARASADARPTATA